MSANAFYDRHKTAPQVGDKLIFPCGLFKEVLEVDGEYLKLKGPPTPESCDLAKAKLFRNGRYIPAPLTPEERN